MSTQPSPSKFPLNGLLLFVGAMVAILVVLTVGGNVLFERFSHKLLTPATTLQANASAHQSTSVAASPAPPAQTVSDSASAKPAAISAAFTPPAESTLPDGDYGKVIRLGEQIFMETGQYASRYVGNNLSCANCHLDAGRKADSAPLWASFIHYPAFRSKTGQVDTLASRIQGCFQFSMNGKAPAADDEIITALQTYAFWLAKGAPVGTPVPGSGYPKLKKPAQPADYARGEKVYAQNCALCHGADGLGQRAGDKQVFPPLWGPKSFNWGAGMHQLANSAGFIQANMPLGKGGTLSEQDAWDVALFMNSHERPQDPRFKGSVAETRKKYHDTEDSMYGMTVNGHVLGSP
jgi:thiosulfate dehydrogenase